MGPVDSLSELIDQLDWALVGKYFIFLFINFIAWCVWYPVYRSSRIYWNNVASKRDNVVRSQMSKDAGLPASRVPESDVRLSVDQIPEMDVFGDVEFEETKEEEHES